MYSLMFHTHLLSSDGTWEFIILVLPVDIGASPATAMRGFPKLFKTFIMGIKIVMLSESLHVEKVQFFRSLCSANLTGCEGICPEANDTLSAQGSLLS